MEISKKGLKPTLMDREYFKIVRDMEYDVAVRK